MFPQTWTGTNFYRLLGVPQSSSQKAIQAAFRKKARAYHPDTSESPGSTAEEFAQITLAYEVLSQPSVRENYDSYLAEETAKRAVERVAPEVNAAPKFNRPISTNTWSRNTGLAIGAVLLTIGGVSVGVVLSTSSSQPEELGVTPAPNPAPSSPPASSNQSPYSSEDRAACNEFLEYDWGSRTEVPGEKPEQFLIQISSDINAMFFFAENQALITAARDHVGAIGRMVLLVGQAGEGFDAILAGSVADTYNYLYSLCGRVAN